MLQNLTAVHSREIEIENNQIGTRNAIVGVRLVNKSYCQFSIFDDAKIGSDTCILDRCTDEIHICCVVFNNENAARTTCLLFTRKG